MAKWQIGETVDTAAEVERLLQYNGFHFRREADRFRLVFSESGRKWETMIVCQGTIVLIYGRYPFPSVHREQALAACQEINSQVVLGSMFLSDEHVLFRTGTDLIDAYSAYESIGRALEYNAGVMVRFWSQMAACIPVPMGDLGRKPV